MPAVLSPLHDELLDHAGGYCGRPHSRWLHARFVTILPSMLSHFSILYPRIQIDLKVYKIHRMGKVSTGLHCFRGKESQRLSTLQ
jgi:hypothetical protein